MRYLIDGYNLLFQSPIKVHTLEASRVLFIETLDAMLAHTRLRVSIIFDSSQQESQFFPSKKRLAHLEVIFSPQGLSADDYLLEILNAETRDITLVTSDRELQSQAKALGARTQSIETFLKHLSSASKKSFQEIKSQEETQIHFQRLLKIFEKKLKEEP